jgi:hypothetical protein
MDQGLTYQKARRIRGTKVTDLLADQLLYEKSITKAVGRTISLKAQSKIKGIKEKFDPLNIAKFLTGGSKLAPALLGRLMGRDVRDIEYFTGRNRPIRVGKGTASKITSGIGEGGDIEGINEQLLKIYSFLKTSTDKDIKRKEKEQNFKEEREIESKKRHDEFIAALTKLKTGKSTAQVVTKTEQKEGFDFGGLVEGIVSKIKDMVQGIIDTALSPFAWLKNLTSFAEPLLKFLGSNVFRLVLMNPVFLGMAAAGALAYWLISQASEEANQKTAESLIKAGDVSAESAAIMAAQEPTDENLVQKRKENLLSQRPSNKKSFAFWKDSDLQKKYLEEIGFDEKSGLTEQEKKQGYIRLDDNANPVKKSSAEPVKLSAPTMPDETDAETARLTRQNAAASPMSTSSNQLNTVMAENVAANLPATPNTGTQNTVNNVVQNANNRQQKIAKLSEIAVHNDEPTFMRMIMGSTRLV